MFFVATVVGRFVGDWEGCKVGSMVGDWVGVFDGDDDGFDVTGGMEGPDFGLCEGFIRGASDGSSEGCNVGKKLGSSIHGCTRRKYKNCGVLHCLDLKTVLALDSRMGSGMASLSGVGRVVWLDLALAPKKDLSSGAHTYTKQYNVRCKYVFDLLPPPRMSEFFITRRKGFMNVSIKKQTWKLWKVTK